MFLQFEHFLINRGVGYMKMGPGPPMALWAYILDLIEPQGGYRGVSIGRLDVGEGVY